LKLSFHGADRTVTGSCHVVQCLGRRILVDCGMFQGSRELHEENAGDFGFDPSSIDCVLLTHAHLDHCGRLPLLVKRGFRGEIIATDATLDLARIVLLDSAHLQEEEARHRSRHRSSAHGSENGPLFTIVDALDAVGRFGRQVTYGRSLEIFTGLSTTFLDAGHILGSASILLEFQEDSRRRSVFFSGDIGNEGRPLLKPPQTPASAEIVVMETTYGDRHHRPFKGSVDELYEVVASTLQGHGNVIIPTFALERAQELLYFFRQGIEENRLPPSLEVFLDSPMAISATQIFKRYTNCYQAPLTDLFERGVDPFHIPGLQMVRERAESVAINRITGGAVIMAGSGMCTGGRIRHHLINNASRPEASLLFVGFAAMGTLAPGRSSMRGISSGSLAMRCRSARMCTPSMASLLMLIAGNSYNGMTGSRTSRLHSWYTGRSQ
jgi:metallo-beta-lactamase family protein